MSSNPESRNRRYLWTAVRLSVAAGVLAFTLSRVPLDQVGGAIGRMTPGSFLLGALILASTHAIGGIRWRWALTAFGAKTLPPMTELVRLYMVGTFFNTYVPGGLGGDVLRAGVTQRAIGSGTAAWVSVVAERALGLAAMLFLVGVMVALVVPIPGVETWMVFGIAGLIPAGVVGGLLVLRSVKDRFELGELRVLPLLGTWGISLIGHALVALSGHIVISRVAPSTQLLENLVVVPLAQVAVFFPATVGGLGVREAAFVELYARFDVPAAEATAGALVFLGINLTAAAIGGVVHVLTPAMNQPTEGDPQAD